MKHLTIIFISLFISITYAVDINVALLKNGNNQEYDGSPIWDLIEDGLEVL